MASAEDPSGKIARASAVSSVNPSPGEVILKKLFAQFVVSSKAKLINITKQPLANPLSQYLQRGEDLNFDQLISSLKDVASFCLRSLLIALNDWRKMLIKQIKINPWSLGGSSSDHVPDNLSKKEQEYLMERLELAVEFIYCMTLVEILQKLPVHPVPEPFIHDIEALAFHHFRAQEPLKERSTNNPNVANAKRVADLYAEVIGVVSLVRFLSVRMRFFAELKNPQNSTSVIISVIEGLSFVRVKMYPVEELEEWFSFLQECANYMLEEAKGEKVKHAMSALLVEILTPVAAVIKYEMSMPAVKKLVGTLYSYFYDQSKKLRHSTAYIPLITILLAIAEDKFFLNNWHGFVTQQVLPNLKRGDNKLQRVALDSLYRLLWVYMIRIKAEGNVTTFNRLRPIIDTLFPRSSAKGIQLKDFPPNIFVKIIYFIARERVDNAMNDIVAELVTKYKGGLNPERVIIGLRAFLMIADSLEKKEKDPPMPPAFSTIQSGSVTRTKTKFLTSTLTEKIAKKIGIMKYYQPIRRALSTILRQLDTSVGNLVSTNSAASRAPEEALGGERKPKIDLLKTCIAAIPRIMPEGMSKNEVVELLSRLTIHLDNDIPRMAVTALQNIVNNYPDWRTDILRGYACFILDNVPDSCPLVLEGALKTLGQLLGHWRSLVTDSSGSQEELDLSNPPSDSIVWVESCALVTFCSYRSLTRKYSLAILKEVRALLEIFKQNNRDQRRNPTVLDVMEKATPTIVKSYLSTLTPKERTELKAHQHLTLWWLADRPACFLEIGGGRNTLRDAWSQCIVGLLEPSMLPQQCPIAVQLTWPYILQRMLKAYYIVDPSSATERPDRLPTLRNPRGGYTATPELFLWRNYLFFACCSAPPSLSPVTHVGLQECKRVLGEKHSAKDLFRIVLPLIRAEDEIGEVFISAMGLASPLAFQDLIDNLKPWITDSLDLKKSDTVKKRRRREIQKVHITRIIALSAENSCFKLCPGALNKDGELCHPILQFVEGIKQYLESDADRIANPATDLRLHYSSLIANIINSFFDDPAQLKLFTRETRYSLFYLVAGWSGPFWHHNADIQQEQEEKLVKQARSSSLLQYNVLRAMSALLCCGPVFEQEALRGGRYIYRWLENMLCSSEEKIQQLGRKTVQLLLQNNKEPFLLNWVLEHCYSSKLSCASQCFQALSSTFAKNPNYPCKMITILHVILYKTASLDHQTRERAMQLLYILDKRFFASTEVGSRRPELLGLVTASRYSNLHVLVSEELAFANPELTLPFFCEMIQRFENTPVEGRRSILQIMKPWLRNIELVEESTRVPSHQAHYVDTTLGESIETTEKSSNPVLSGCGWGSLDGTYLVLHNLLYLTAKYGDDFMPEIESLWCALCTWPTNIRVALNYLARLTCVAGNLSLMLQQAKRVIVYFSHNNSKITIAELMREVQCVELITLDVHPNDAPPFFKLMSRSVDSNVRRSEVGRTAKQHESEGESWAANWRVEVRNHEGQAVPLPVPASMRFFATMKDILKIPCRHINMHRSNFALILLSEVIPEVNDFDWTTQLPVLLHVMTLGLDLHRPVVYEHSKRLMGNLIVLLACRDDYKAACEARMTQYDMFTHGSAVISLGGQDEGSGAELERYNSVTSFRGGKGSSSSAPSNLAQMVHDLIKFVSLRDGRRMFWPFQDSSRTAEPFAKVSDLGTLVEQILSVFETCFPDSLLDKWTRVALSWATSCSSQQFASQSFQICRALKIPLNSAMLREVLTRLAESASDQSDELQNYVLEIFLTLENAIDNTDKSELHPSQQYPEHSRQTSDITPTILSTGEEVSPKKLESSVSDLIEEAGSPVSIQLHVPPSSMGKPPLPSTVTSSTPISVNKSGPVPATNETISSTGSDDSSIRLPKSLPGVALGHRKKHSRGHSVSKIELPVDMTEESPPPPSSSTSLDTRSSVIEKTKPLHVESSGKLTSSSYSNVVNSEKSTDISKDTIGPLTRPQSAGGRLDPMGNPPGGGGITRSHNEPSALATVVNTARENNTTTNTKESTPRKTSAPPIHLMNLFEPLPSASPSKLSIDGTPQHQLQRPMSMIVSSGNEGPGGSVSSLVPSATTSSLSSLGTLPMHSEINSQSSPGVLAGKQDILDEKDEEEDEDIIVEEETEIEKSIELSVPQSTPPSTNLPIELDIKKESISESSKEDENSSPKNGVLSRSHNTSVSSEGSENISIIRVPSHPDLRIRPQLAKVDSLDSSPIMRARSVNQLQTEIDGDGLMKRRAYSGSRDAVPGFTGLLKENSNIRRSYDRLRTKGTTTAPPSSSRLPLSHQNSPSKLEKERVSRRISADPDREKERVSSAKGKRPRSMIETTSNNYVHYRNASVDFMLTASHDFLSQLFWTSVSLLESDYENEYYLAQHLFGKVISQLDLTADATYSRLESILKKMKSEKFSGVQRLLLKGLTLMSTTKSTRELLSKICPYVNRSVFDSNNFKGLPLNIVALLPELILHFEKSTETSREMAETISTSCNLAIPQAHNSELATVLKDMGHLFHLYHIQDFTNTRSIWLKSVCHYLTKGYSTISEELLKLMSKMLEYGSEAYHQPVLWIIHEYLVKLEEGGSIDIDHLSDIVTKPVSQFIKGPLWQDALVVLMRVIKNSSSLVRPPNSHIAVMDLGIFHQTLPGPTLSFEMDLSNTSNDLSLANDISRPVHWLRPQGCQRITRERLLSVINASGPVPVLFSSPSVIFTDEQTLVGPYLELESSEEEDEIEDIEEEDEEERIPSTKASTEVLDNSQPESALINSIGDTFDFLNNYQYSDEEENEDAKNMEGPFSSGREKTYSSSLTSSRSSLVSDEEYGDHGGSEKQPLPQDTPPSLQIYVEGESSESFVSPTTVNSSSLGISGNMSLELSTSLPKQGSPSLTSVHFVGLEESYETNSTDMQRSLEQIPDNDIEEDEDYREREDTADERFGMKDTSGEGEELGVAITVLEDKETIVDIGITTQVLKTTEETASEANHDSTQSIATTDDQVTTMFSEEPLKETTSDYIADISEDSKKEVSPNDDDEPSPEVRGTDVAPTETPLLSVGLPVNAPVEPSSELPVQPGEVPTVVVSTVLDDSNDAVGDLNKGDSTEDLTSILPEQDKENEDGRLSLDDPPVEQTEFTTSEKNDIHLEETENVDQIEKRNLSTQVSNDQEPSIAEATQQQSDLDDDGITIDPTLLPKHSISNDSNEDTTSTHRDLTEMATNITQIEPDTDISGLDSNGLEPDLERPETDPDRPEPDPDRPESDPDRPEPDPDRPEPDPDRPESDPDRPESDPDRPEPDPDRPETDPDTPETDPNVLEVDLDTDPDRPETDTSKPEPDSDVLEPDPEPDTNGLDTDSDRPEPDPDTPTDIDQQLLPDTTGIPTDKPLHDTQEPDTDQPEPGTDELEHDIDQPLPTNKPETDVNELEPDPGLLELDGSKLEPDIPEPEPDVDTSEPLLELSLSDDDDDDDDDELADTKYGHRVDAHRAAHFISIANEEIEEMWTDHVSNLCRSKSPSQAVNTFYLFYRLFTVYRKQTCTLTEQACNYMEEGFWNISTHFVVTAELMNSELYLPNVYLDTEAVSRSEVLDRFVFLVLEMHSASENLKAKRRSVLDSINKCKEFLQTGESPFQKCLNLCHSIQQLHFHLLIFVSAYTKLLTLLSDSVGSSGLVDISMKLSKVRAELDKAVAQGSRAGVYDIPDHSETSQLLVSMNEVQALRHLQELMADGQVRNALSLLHAMRTHYRDEHLFGSGQHDDMDVLFFAFVHFIAEGQEGTFGVSTSAEANMSGSLSRLMSQNVSLLSLLNKHTPTTETNAANIVTDDNDTILSTSIDNS